MIPADEMATMRATHDLLLLDTVSVTRAGGESVFDETTGEWDDPPSSTIYAGPAKVRPQSLSVGYDREVGGGDIRMNMLVLTLPAETPLAADDRVEVTASTFDAALIGKTFRVTDVMQQTLQVTRNAMLEEVG